MRLYVRVFVLYPPLRVCVCSPRVLCCNLFDTQDPNDPTTFPGYQGVPEPQSLGTSPQGPDALVSLQTSQQPGYHGLPTV